MKGYGYSIWLIPSDKTILKYISNPEHIYHTTVKTNIKTIKEGISYLDRYKFLTENRSILIKIDNKPINFEKMYQYDPIEKSWGYKVSILNNLLNKEIDHQSHLTAFYNRIFNKNVDIPLEKPLFVFCNLNLVDTRNEYPFNWNIIK